MQFQDDAKNYPSIDSNHHCPYRALPYFITCNILNEVLYVSQIRYQFSLNRFLDRYLMNTEMVKSKGLREFYLFVKNQLVGKTFMTIFFSYYNFPIEAYGISNCFSLVALKDKFPKSSDNCHLLEKQS